MGHGDAGPGRRDRRGAGVAEEVEHRRGSTEARGPAATAGSPACAAGRLRQPGRLAADPLVHRGLLGEEADLPAWRQPELELAAAVVDDPGLDRLAVPGRPAFVADRSAVGPVEAGVGGGPGGRIARDVALGGWRRPVDDDDPEALEPAGIAHVEQGVGRRRGRHRPILRQPKIRRGFKLRLVSPIEAIAILAAGLAAGTINTIVGSGSLITFPTLLAFGYAPVLANVSNTVGLVPGSLSGAIGYRRELRRPARPGDPARASRPTAGGLTGASAPARPAGRRLPADRADPDPGLGRPDRDRPRLSRAMGDRRDAPGQEHTVPLVITLYLTGIYGGYFGAGQGVIMMALLSVFLPDDLQRLNALKNVLAVLINGVAAILFILLSPIAWPAAILLAIGAIIGGQVGALVGRRLPANVLRVAIIVVGTVVGVRLLIG